MNSVEVAELLQKAKQSLEAARLLLRDNYADFSAARAYYSMFYAVEALLLNKGLSFSKHSAVISAFGREFVKAGDFSARFHKAILEAFEVRNTGDYGPINSVDPSKAPKN